MIIYPDKITCCQRAKANNSTKRNFGHFISLDGMNFTNSFNEYATLFIISLLAAGFYTKHFSWCPKTCLSRLRGLQPPSPNSYAQGFGASLSTPVPVWLIIILKRSMGYLWSLTTCGLLIWLSTHVHCTMRPTHRVKKFPRSLFVISLNYRYLK